MRASCFPGATNTFSRTYTVSVTPRSCGHRPCQRARPCWLRRTAGVVVLRVYDGGDAPVRHH